MIPFIQISRFRRGLLLLGVAFALSASPAHAARDALIEGGKLCTQQFPVAEQRYTIPTHLLAAISTTESGRWHKQLGMAVPWPWTINVEGKGYYFDSKAEAIAATQRFMAQGKSSIDVGCMQVNLKHHSKAFANLNEAFEPSTNVAYAAKFLRDNYAELKDWIKATAAYHSRTQVHGQRYLAQIEKSWNRIVTKVAAARASQGSAAATASVEEAPRPASRPIASTRNVQVIHVSDGTSVVKPVKPEVLVIHGSAAPAVKTAPEPTKLASAAPITAVATTPQAAPEATGSSIRRVVLDNPAPTGQVAPTSKSKFVFAN